MVLNIICLFIGLHAASAWLAPERCQQGGFIRNASYHKASTVTDIKEIARKQNENLLEEFKDAKIFYIPSTGSIPNFCNLYDNCSSYQVFVAHSCQFETYEPSLLASVYCQDGIECNLEHSVTTTASYEATEGYNWGVKVTATAGFEPFFEIGGEASTGGTYTCAYTKGKTETDIVQCSSSNGAAKTLALYSVRTDMICEFGTATMVREVRGDSQDFSYVKGESYSADEIFHFWDSALIEPVAGALLPNLDKVSNSLMEKLTTTLPYYNPYTDLVSMILYSDGYVLYFKVGSMTTGNKKVIPFTRQNGDSVFQYACLEQ